MTFFFFFFFCFSISRGGGAQAPWAPPPLDTRLNYMHNLYCQHTCIRFGADYNIHNISLFSTIIPIQYFTLSPELSRFKSTNNKSQLYHTDIHVQVLIVSLMISLLFCVLKQTLRALSGLTTVLEIRLLFLVVFSFFEKTTYCCRARRLSVRPSVCLSVRPSVRLWK